MTTLTPTILFLLLAGVGSRIAAAQPADTWIEAPALYPPSAPTRSADPAPFKSLKAEVIIGQLNVFWRADQFPGATNAILHYSVDHPGHWPAREWRQLPMRRRQNLFDTKIPITDIDVPCVYFVEVQTGAKRASSPARIVHPREADMEKPSAVFWPFLEGFENGHANWTALTGALSDSARSGKQALRVRLAPGKRSASVSTTRIRGWHFLNQRARAIRVWLKSSRQGRARFILTSHARTSAQTQAISSITPEIGSAWQAVDLPVNSFDLASPAGVDLFTIKFSGDAEVDFFVDDIQFLGRWRVKGL